MTDALRGAIVALVNAAGALVIAFHVALTDTQLAAISALVNAMLVVWLLARHKQTMK